MGAQHTGFALTFKTHHHVDNFAATPYMLCFRGSFYNPNLVKGARDILNLSTEIIPAADGC